RRRPSLRGVSGCELEGVHRRAGIPADEVGRPHLQRAIPVAAVGRFGPAREGGANLFLGFRVGRGGQGGRGETERESNRQHFHHASLRRVRFVHAPQKTRKEFPMRHRFLIIVGVLLALAACKKAENPSSSITATASTDTTS